MEQKSFLRLLILFLVVSYVFSAAVCTTRNLKSINEVSSVQDSLAQGEVDMRNDGEVLEVEQGYMEGRMDLESTDYPGTGANNHHDPKTPGRP
ncbi:hypothetical protein L1049_007987 [Liquidambar formosana]|uniref:Uncharacterized protein n=1 Tax=Liquidambar formosana TaxID=63359 RepID=A0AAP0S3L1_LIQFO